MDKTICVTGSEGAIGKPLVSALERRGIGVRRLDTALPAGDPGHVDVRDERAVREAVEGCIGIVHLAAISRVVWGERDPETCWAVNVTGTECITAAASRATTHPWTILASSREVYGNQQTLPVNEDAPCRPVNTYGRSKLAAERVVDQARDQGVETAILRLSNVYGGLHDHTDRVVPAFGRAAAEGSTMEVFGADSTCDFTHIDDTVAAFLAVIDRLEAGKTLPDAINIATGIGTTLLELARLAADAGGGRARIVVRPSKDFAVDHFVGAPDRARHHLGWQAGVSIDTGIRQLVSAWAHRTIPR